MENTKKKQYVEPKYEVVTFDETIVTADSGSCEKNYYANSEHTGCEYNQLWVN